MTVARHSSNTPSSPSPSRSSSHSNLPKHANNHPNTSNNSSNSSSPGMIHLPSPLRPTKRSSSRSKPPPAPTSDPSTTPTAPVEAVITPQKQPRKRGVRNANKNAPTNPSALSLQLAAVSLEDVDVASPAPDGALPSMSIPTTPPSPTKSARNNNSTNNNTKKGRGNRASRQASPPSPPTFDPAPSPSDGFSQSAPSDLAHFPSSSAPPTEDEWDMPIVQSAMTPVALTWQQQEAIAAATSAGSNRSPTPRSGHQQKQQQRAGAKGRGAKTSHGNGSVSDSGLSSSTKSLSAGAATGNLTWQQQLLQTSSSHSSISSLSAPNGHQRSSSPLKPLSSSSASNYRSKHELKDAITFGLPMPSSIAPSTASPSHPSTPIRKSNSNGQYRSQQERQDAHLPSEERYAGPTFHNSPAPSSLPTPSFMLRRKIVEAS